MILAQRIVLSLPTCREFIFGGIFSFPGPGKMDNLIPGQLRAAVNVLSENDKAMK